MSRLTLTVGESASSMSDKVGERAGESCDMARVRLWTVRRLVIELGCRSKKR